MLSWCCLGLQESILFCCFKEEKGRNRKSQVLLKINTHTHTHQSKQREISQLEIQSWDLSLSRKSDFLYVQWYDGFLFFPRIDWFELFCGIEQSRQIKESCLLLDIGTVPPTPRFESLSRELPLLKKRSTKIFILEKVQEFGLLAKIKAHEPI